MKKSNIQEQRATPHSRDHCVVLPSPTTANEAHSYGMGSTASANAAQLFSTLSVKSCSSFANCCTAIDSSAFSLLCRTTRSSCHKLSWANTTIRQPSAPTTVSKGRGNAPSSDEHPPAKLLCNRRLVLLNQHRELIRLFVPPLLLRGTHAIEFHRVAFDALLETLDLVDGEAFVPDEEVARGEVEIALGLEDVMSVFRG